MIALSSFVIADVIYYQDDFEDGIMDNDIWDNTTLVTEENGYMQLVGQGSPYTRAYLKTPYNYSQQNLLIYMNASCNGDGYNYFCVSLRDTAYTGRNGYKWEKDGGGGVQFGRCKDDSSVTYSQIIATPNESIDLWLKWNNTHQCGDGITDLADYNPDCSTDMPTGDSHYAMLGAVNAGSLLRIYEMTICEDTNGNFRCDPLNFSIDWDTKEPLDNDVTNDVPLVFEADLIEQTGFVNCSLYTNATGTLKENESLTNLNNSFTINYTSQLDIVEDIEFKLVCNDELNQSNSSTKTITFDFISVLIDVENPSNNSIVLNTTTSVNITIEFSNWLLDYVTYDVFAPNGSLKKTNSSDVSVQTFTFNDEIPLYISELGTFTIVAWGNDSAGNFNNITTTFIYKRIPETQYLFLDIIPLIVSIIILIFLVNLVRKEMK